MSSQGNVFSALQAEKRKKTTTHTPTNAMFASFVNQPHSTTAWGDDSDDEIHLAAISNTENVVADEEEEDSETEEEEEEEDQDESIAPLKKAVAPARTLSKKEKKELEMKEFEAALADLGIKTEDIAERKKIEKDEVKVEETEGITGSLDKKKKKKKSKKATKVAESDTRSVEMVDIKAVVKTKLKKKKISEPVAVRIAREEKAKNKNKSKKDKSSFNEFSI